MIYVVWPKAYIHGRRRRISIIIEEDYNPKALKSQNLN